MTVIRKGEIVCTVQYLLICYSEGCAAKNYREPLGEYFWKNVCKYLNKIQYIAIKYVLLNTMVKIRRFLY